MRRSIKCLAKCKIVPFRLNDFWNGSFHRRSKKINKQNAIFGLVSGTNNEAEFYLFLSLSFSHFQFIKLNRNQMESSHIQNCIHLLRLIAVGAVDLFNFPVDWIVKTLFWKLKCIPQIKLSVGWICWVPCDHL